MSPTVLYLDDDISIQRFVESVFSSLGLDVLCAATTSQADAILKDNPVDALICDVQLGDENGMTYCARLRTAGHRVPMILVSAALDPTTADPALSRGPTAYLNKPFDMIELHGKILELIAKT